MRLGLHIAASDWQGGAARMGATLREIVETAEEAGFDTIDVADHLWQHPIMGGPVANQLEALSTLGYIAALTTRVRLMTLAACPPYRAAGLLAKEVTTLDVLSGGRMMLGIGAGDYPEEAAGLGLPWPSQADRYELLEETVRFCLGMWQGEHGSDDPFDGKHIRAERVLNMPQVLSRPHPPILIAGSGERRTLPLVARYGDACNIPPGPDLGHKLDVLKRLCDEAGRDYGTIEKTMPYGFDVGANGEKADELVEQLRGFSAMGIETVYGWVVNVDGIEPIRIMGRDVIPEVAGFPA